MSVCSQYKLAIDGFSIAAQTWKRSSLTLTTSSSKILCLHGWLDNSNTFTKLAPYLSNAGHEVVCIDLPGHGHSSHALGHYQHIRHVSLIKAILNKLGWEAPDTSLIGHSMGGGIALLFAGCFPEMVENLILIDSFGPYTATNARAPTDLRKAIEFEEKMKPPTSYSTNKKYSTLADAISARVRIVSTYPGSQSISREAAEALVRRGAFQAARTADSSSETICSDDLLLGTDSTGALNIDESVGPVSFRYDPRLLHPSHTYMTGEQVDAYASAITCPVLLLEAEHGWPVKPGDYATRKQILEDKRLLTHKVLPGSHHMHLDPHSCERVGKEISDFLAE